VEGRGRGGGGGQMTVWEVGGEQPCHVHCLDSRLPTAMLILVFVVAPFPHHAQ
jgi:hypothetical protein